MTNEPPEPQESQSQEAEDRLSLERIEAGGIPVSAERRLRELREGGRGGAREAARSGARGGAFTSDLSINGFALTRQLGLTPLSQVMGSSIYQMGYQGAWGQPGSWGGLGVGSTFMIELETFSQALNHVRARALDRLAQEATLVGADAVIEVETRAGESALEGSSISLEHTVLGTAIRRHDSRAEQPVLTELSVAEYAQLVRAGFEPLGIVAWSSVFFASYTFGVGRPGSGGFGEMLGGMGAVQNFELHEFTQAFYNARETVMTQLNAQAHELGASGIVGVRIAHTARREELSGMGGIGGAVGGFGGRELRGLMVTFNAIGTAIRQRGDAAVQAPEPVLDLFN
jgi:uncharacterized protein YbjQ (UPF0145 family)